MGATMRITWPLLSLSFLFLSICSNTDSQSTTSVMTTGGSTTIPTVTTMTVTVVGTSGAPSTVKSETTPDPKFTMLTTVVTTPAVTTTSKVSDKPTSARPQVATITNNHPIITTNPPISNGIAATASTAATTASTSTAAATTSPLTVSGPVATPDGSAVTSNAAVVQTLKASTPETTSGTAAPGNMVTTEITKVSIGTLTSEQQSKTHTTIATMTSQDSNGGAAKTTMAVTGHGEPGSRATEPAGNTGTTSTFPTLTKAGPSSPPLVTKAGTKPLQTTIATTTTITNTRTINTRTTGGPSSTTAAQLKTFLYSLNNGHEKEEEKDLVEVCRRLMVHLQDGNCTLTWQHHNGKIHFQCVEINGKVKTTLATQYYEEIIKKPTDSKTLIAILASCGALLIMIVILVVCASHHRKPYNDNQQHLTEELHTVENGYHDNPTLEVMEVQPEMQEKKAALNREFNDSWIVPIDNLLKGDVADEEDTHL